MKHRSFVLIIIVAIGMLLLATAWNFQQDKKSISAYIVKVKNSAERRTDPTVGWVKALMLDQLKAGHEVRTQEKSLAVIKFADESQVIVREKSVLTVQGEVEGKRILSRDVFLEHGRVVFDVKKQKTEQFRFSSPISVASIRGSQGGNGFDLRQADLTMVTGEALFRNTQSGCEQVVGSGQIGITDTSGLCSSRGASQFELYNNNPYSRINLEGDQGGAPGDTSGTRASLGSSTQFSLNTSLSSALQSGQGASIRVALVNPPADITQASMFYRIQGDAVYKQLAMTIEGNNVSGTIPSSDVRTGATGTFEYYFSMLGANGTTYTFPETNPEANPYTLPITPRIVRIRIPVTDPSGATRFLEISYEE
jgi:hypothetical protein